jgi:tetratricopeptide (TPR) repeat protein
VASPAKDAVVVPSRAELPRAEVREYRNGGDAERLRAPDLPEGAAFSALDKEAQRELGGLPKALAELVGNHLVAAGMLVDEDPERALEHARFARVKAARVGLVREGAGLTAYHAGEWAEALSELRAARRMSSAASHLAVMADCERALGRPERAIELAREAQGTDLSLEEAVELRIVAAGARRDMGQLDAAVVALQGPDLEAGRRDLWSARLFYAYADNLAAAGRGEEAVRWFLNAAEADDENATDAAERAIELGDQLVKATAEPEIAEQDTAETEVAETETKPEDVAPETPQS